MICMYYILPAFILKWLFLKENNTPQAVCVRVCICVCVLSLSLISVVRKCRMLSHVKVHLRYNKLAKCMQAYGYILAFVGIR